MHHSLTKPAYHANRAHDASPNKFVYHYPTPSPLPTSLHPSIALQCKRPELLFDAVLLPIALLLKLPPAPVRLDDVPASTVTMSSRGRVRKPPAAYNAEPAPNPRLINAEARVCGAHTAYRVAIEDFILADKALNALLSEPATTVAFPPSQSVRHSLPQPQPSHPLHVAPEERTIVSGVTARASAQGSSPVAVAVSVAHGAGAFLEGLQMGGGALEGGSAAAVIQHRLQFEAGAEGMHPLILVTAETESNAQHAQHAQHAQQEVGSLLSAMITDISASDAGIWAVATLPATETSFVASNEPPVPPPPVAPPTSSAPPADSAEPASRPRPSQPDEYQRGDSVSAAASPHAVFQPPPPSIPVAGTRGNEQVDAVGASEQPIADLEPGALAEDRLALGMNEEGARPLRKRRAPTQYDAEPAPPPKQARLQYARRML